MKSKQNQTTNSVFDSLLLLCTLFVVCTIFTKRNLYFVDRHLSHIRALRGAKSTNLFFVFPRTEAFLFSSLYYYSHVSSYWVGSSHYIECVSIDIGTDIWKSFVRRTKNRFNCFASWQHKWCHFAVQTIFVDPKSISNHYSSMSHVMSWTMEMMILQSNHLINYTRRHPYSPHIFYVGFRNDFSAAAFIYGYL